MGRTDEVVKNNLPCSDGVSRNGYEATLAEVRYALRSQEKDARLQFTVFKDEFDVIRRPSKNEVLGRKPSGRKDPKVKDMVERLQAQLDRKAGKAAHS
ncbi:MAG: hypothetical protein AMXMBFR44_0220 [Candidatus Campbellbacteria bacterium]